MAATQMFCDSFDHYDTAHMLLKWTALQGVYASNGVIDPTGGTNGSGAFTGFATNLAYTFPIADNAFVIGFSFRYTVAGSSGAILQIASGATQLVSIQINSSAELSLVRPQDGYVFGSDSTALAINTWYYIELKVQISTATAAGWCQVRVNEVVVIDASSAYTAWGTATTANNVFVGSICGTGDSFVVFIDDFVAQTGSGADYFGAVKIEALYPNSDGAFSDLLATGASSGYICISENPPNDGTTLISGANSGNKSTFGFTQPSLTVAAVYAMQVVIMADSSGTEAKVFEPVFYIGSSTYTGTSLYPTNTYMMYTQVFLTNPATSAAWGTTDTATLQAGIEIVS